jgi:hypothetical protein
MDERPYRFSFLELLQKQHMEVTAAKPVHPPITTLPAGHQPHQVQNNPAGLASEFRPSGPVAIQRSGSPGHGSDSDSNEPLFYLDFEQSQISGKQRCLPGLASSLDGKSKQTANQVHWTDRVIRQMMFVSGETAEPSMEVTYLVEQIVQQQVKELVCTMTRFAPTPLD